QRLDPLPAGEVSEDALLGVGREDESVTVPLPEFPGKPVPDDEELSHRLCGRAGFADHVEQCVAEVEALEDRADRGRVDVVEDVESWALAAGAVVQFVPERWQ